MLKFRNVVFTGGAVQYQQAVDGEQWPGYYEFLWCTSEDSATPLLDIQVAPGVKQFEGLESVTISDFSAADRLTPRCERPHGSTHSFLYSTNPSPCAFR